MACISIGKFKKKLLFPMLAIILCFIIYNMEYFSGFFFDLKKNDRSPKLYSLYFSFSFLGCFLYGGIFLLISNSSSSRESKLALNKTKEDKSKKDLKKKKEIHLLL
jgi:predicted permease